MLKKTITFHDLDDNELTEDFYFNLSKAELAEMELSTEGGLEVRLKKIIENNNGAQIIEVFKDILGRSYGVRSEDGKRFIKNQDLLDAFMQSDAYSELFMELVTDADAGSAFVRAVLPKDLGNQLENVELPDETQEPKDDRPQWIQEDREPTAEELRTMPKEEMMEAFRRKAGVQK